MLGPDCIQNVHLNWGELWGDVQNITGVQDILAKYSDAFKDELGTLHGTAVKLSVDPTAQPRVFKSRPVPYAVKAKVEAKLKRL